MALAVQIGGLSVAHAEFTWNSSSRHLGRNATGTMGIVVTATDLAAIGAAAGTFLTGAGGVIAALRSPGRQPDLGPARPGDWPMVSVRLVGIRRAETFASWSLGLGVSAARYASGGLAPAWWSR